MAKTHACSLTASACVELLLPYQHVNHLRVYNHKINRSSWSYCEIVEIYHRQWLLPYYVIFLVSLGMPWQYVLVCKISLTVFVNDAVIGTLVENPVKLQLNRWDVYNPWEKLLFTVTQISQSIRAFYKNQLILIQMSFLWQTAIFAIQYRRNLLTRWFPRNEFANPIWIQCIVFAKKGLCSQLAWASLFHWEYHSCDHYLSF